MIQGPSITGSTDRICSEMLFLVYYAKPKTTQDGTSWLFPHSEPPPPPAHLPHPPLQNSLSCQSTPNTYAMTRSTVHTCSVCIRSRSKEEVRRAAGYSSSPYMSQRERDPGFTVCEQCSTRSLVSDPISLSFQHLTTDPRGFAIC